LIISIRNRLIKVYSAYTVNK